MKVVFSGFQQDGHTQVLYKKTQSQGPSTIRYIYNSFEWYFFEFHDSLKYQTIGTLAHCTKTELSTMKALHFYNRKFNMRSYHSAKKNV